jgi:hypothetical protein
MEPINLVLTLLVVFALRDIFAQLEPSHRSPALLENTKIKKDKKVAKIAQQVNIVMSLAVTQKF